MRPILILPPMLLTALLLTALLLTALLTSPRAVANPFAGLVAGRTMEQHAALINDTDRTVRLRAVRSLAIFGDAAAPLLASALDHSDAAMRYLAATSLGRIGGAGLDAASDNLTVLADDDPSPAVRLAASFALCRAGQSDQRLGMLIDSLQHPDRGMACSAAELIGQIGAPAAAAIPSLRQAYQANTPGSNRGDYHVGGAAQNALRMIEHALESEATP